VIQIVEFRVQGNGGPCISLLKRKTRLMLVIFYAGSSWILTSLTIGIIVSVVVVVVVEPN